MNIFLVKDKNVDSKTYGYNYTDSFEAFVVVALDSLDALKVIEEYQEGCMNECDLEITMIGKAFDSMLRGVVLYSWSSTG